MPRNPRACRRCRLLIRPHRLWWIVYSNSMAAVQLAFFPPSELPLHSPPLSTRRGCWGSGFIILGCDVFLRLGGSALSAWIQRRRQMRTGGMLTYKVFACGSQWGVEGHNKVHAASARQDRSTVRISRREHVPNLGTTIAVHAQSKLTSLGLNHSTAHDPSNPHAVQFQKPCIQPVNRTCNI